jgi:hypothetical protein
VTTTTLLTLPWGTTFKMTGGLLRTAGARGGLSLCAGVRRTLLALLYIPACEVLLLNSGWLLRKRIIIVALKSDPKSDPTGKVHLFDRINPNPQSCPYYLEA